MSLNGIWKFKLDRLDDFKSEGFQKKTFDDSEWSDIPVPSNWELQGFEEPYYKRFDDDKKQIIGLYRTEISIPEKWKGRHTILYFEGVAFGFELWVNEKKVGYFKSAYQRAEFDLSTYAKPGEKNLIAVKVFRNHEELEMDINDDWSLSGIFREVYAYAAPPAHIEDYTIITEINDAHTQAEINGDIVIHYYRPTSVKNGVWEPGFEIPKLSFDLSLSYGGKLLEQRTEAVDWPSYYFFPEFKFKFQVTDPKLWNAETPHLYDLAITLKQDGEAIHRINRRVGIREVSVQDGILMINDQAIKLRGVCRHDEYPDVGRAATEKHWRQDLELMKKANINAVRCAHYTPHTRFLELCDEYGFYVADEIPFGFGDHLLVDPGALGLLLGRAQRNVETDKNHPSVILWGIGNEHASTRIMTKLADYVKLLDPTRPTMFPGNVFHEVMASLPASIDIYAPHYYNHERHQRLSTDPLLKHPIIHGEYNHSLDVAFDGLEDHWKIIEENPQDAGGFIWLWADQGLYRKVNGREVIDPKTNLNLQGKGSALVLDRWVHDNTIIDSHGADGLDGIVYADRVPQTDYWETRKVYSPFIIMEDFVDVNDGEQTVILNCENRYDFLNLDTVKIHCSLSTDNKTTSLGTFRVSAVPHGKAQLSIPLNISSAAAERLLLVEVEDKNGRSIYERSIQLRTNGKAKDYRSLVGSTLIADPKSLGKMTAVPKRIKIANGEIEINEHGLLSISNDSGPVYEGPFLRVGRPITLTELRNEYGGYLTELDGGTWKHSILKSPKLLEQKYYEGKGMKTLVTKFNYQRPDKAEESVDMTVTLTVEDGKYADIAYEITPRACTGQVLELGISFLLPDDHEKISWLGGGPYPSFPTKERLNERGFHSLVDDCRHYAGNRMNVDAAFCFSKEGEGLGILTKQSNVAWGKFEGQRHFSHNLKVASHGTKLSRQRVIIPMKDEAAAKGSFRLILLDDQLDWQSELRSLFEVTATVRGEGDKKFMKLDIEKQ